MLEELDLSDLIPVKLVVTAESVCMPGIPSGV